MTTTLAFSTSSPGYHFCPVCNEPEDRYGCEDGWCEAPLDLMAVDEEDEL